MEVSDVVIDYIDKYWKPNQDDSHIIVEKNTENYAIQVIITTQIKLQAL